MLNTICDSGGGAFLYQIYFMKRFFLYLLLIYSLSSCINVKKIEKSYELFQTGLDSLGSFEYKELKLKEGDNISIQVYTTATQDQSQVLLFNLPGSGAKAGSYTVNNLGTIELPKMGSVKVIGLTCNQVKEIVKNEWSKYVKDIALDVQLNGFFVNVLGEVKSPGNKSFKSEKATVIDAISQSGGLSDDGKRENIILIREENGKRTTYKIDLRDASVYQNPAFQLQQNDMIYVSASERKFQNIRNANFQQTVMPIASLSGLGLSVVNMLIVLFALKK